MLATTHAITGSVIAMISPSPLVAYLAAILSHPILDLIPHWDLMTRHVKRSQRLVIVSSFVDAAAGFSLGFILFGGEISPFRLLGTMFAAQLPDWIEAPYVVFGWKFPPFSWVKAFQHRFHRKLPYPDGLYTQLILIFLLLLLSKG